MRKDVSKRFHQASQVRSPIAGNKLTWDPSLVAESLQLALSPSVENPILDTRPSSVGVLFGLVPVSADLLHQVVLGSLGLGLRLPAFGLEEGAQFSGIPAAVRGDDVVVPVLLHKGFQVLAVCGSGVRDGVVREPAFELGLMPLVVYCDDGLSVLIDYGATG